MGKSASVAPCTRFEADGVGFLNPFFYADLVTVESCMASNCGEFAGIKIRIEHGLPNAEELDRVPVAEPIRDKKLSVLRFEHVGERDEIAILVGENRDGRSANIKGAGFGFAHVGGANIEVKRILKLAFAP